MNIPHQQLSFGHKSSWSRRERCTASGVADVATISYISPRLLHTASSKIAPSFHPEGAPPPPAAAPDRLLWQSSSRVSLLLRLSFSYLIYFLESCYSLSTPVSVLELPPVLLCSLRDLGVEASFSCSSARWVISREFPRSSASGSAYRQLSRFPLVYHGTISQPHLSGRDLR